MGVVVSIKPGQLGARIKADHKAYQKAIDQGAMIAATRIVSYLKSISPVYEGVFKSAWQVTRSGNGISAGISNSSPVAGVIERGARPHSVSEEGQKAIREWVRKVLMKVERMLPNGGKSARPMSRAQADRDPRVDQITAAIVRKLRLKGQKGRFLVRNNLDKFVQWTADEINRRIAAHLAGGGK